MSTSVYVLIDGTVELSSQERVRRETEDSTAQLENKLRELVRRTSAGNVSHTHISVEGIATGVSEDGTNWPGSQSPATQGTLEGSQYDVLQARSELQRQNDTLRFVPTSLRPWFS
eukprot:scaffold604_cov384-Prasinococcus_capsulatus_cf.AAC.22